jgi:phosphoribosyl 1,2-cyclic phosphodiesterase
MSLSKDPLNTAAAPMTAPGNGRPALCALASGSRGNSIYISDGRTSVLIDAGLSGVEIERRLRARNLSPGDLDAIVVSHEHADHIQGVGILSRRFRLPVYISRKTAAAAGPLGKLHERVHFDCGAGFHINDLEIHPFSISHDAADPSGFILRTNGLKIGIATDLGRVTAMVAHHLQGCHALILEANHDPDMLRSGPYPWPLKQRILGRSGHLSNDASQTLLGDIVHAQLRHVVLAHLSEVNNTPETALRAFAAVAGGHHFKLSVATQAHGSELILLK